MTKEELRQMRLAAAYKDMLSIKDNDILSWEAVEGEAPYIEEYLLHISIRTYSGPGEIMEHCDVKVWFPINFPKQPPLAQVVSQPLVFHPHFFHSGEFNSGVWFPSIPFREYITLMLLTIAYDPAVSTPSYSYSNINASHWYLENKENTSLFPSDKRDICETIFGKRKYRFVVTK